MNTDAPVALVVEDESLIAMFLCDVLDEAGVPVCGVAGDGETAVRLAGLHDPALIVMDVRLRGPIDGIAAAIEISRTSRAAIVFVTASREDETVARAKAAGAAAILFKPVRPDDLTKTVARVLERQGRPSAR